MNTSLSRVRRAVRTRQRMRKSVFILPSLITITNIYAGFYSVVEALKAYKYLGMNDVALATNHFNIASMCIGWSVLCDFLDGRIARLVNATSDFGVELDSLADVLSFGIAPAVLAYTWGFGGQLPGFEKIAWGVSFMYLICGALRLARFNVQAHKPIPVEDETVVKKGKKFFVGLPIPAAAGLIASIVHFTPSPVPAKYFEFMVSSQTVVVTSRTYATLLLALVVVLSLLMVSTIKFNSFKGTGKPRHPRLLLPFIAFTMFMIYNYSEWTLLVMATIYAGQGPVGKVLGLFRRKSVSLTPENAALTNSGQ